jgi:hypothetical protein
MRKISMRVASLELETCWQSAGKPLERIECRNGGGFDESALLELETC